MSLTFFPVNIFISKAVAGYLFSVTGAVLLAVYVLSLPVVAWFCGGIEFEIMDYQVIYSIPPAKCVGNIARTLLSEKILGAPTQRRPQNPNSFPFEGRTEGNASATAFLATYPHPLFAGRDYTRAVYKSTSAERFYRPLVFICHRVPGAGTLINSIYKKIYGVSIHIKVNIVYSF
ncbi:MAG: hypothetical protein ACAI35_23470 [Candidatus Methylacidiphilales bacterium]|nr:hypothetical protein [Candidatus Methylacidiphilales bacterium]